MHPTQKNEENWLNLASLPSHRGSIESISIILFLVIDPSLFPLAHSQPGKSWLRFSGGGPPTRSQTVGRALRARRVPPPHGQCPWFGSKGHQDLVSNTQDDIRASFMDPCPGLSLPIILEGLGMVAAKPANQFLSSQVHPRFLSAKIDYVALRQ